MVKTQIRNVFEFYATQEELALLTTLNIQPGKINVNIIDMTFYQKLGKHNRVFTIVGETNLSTKKLKKYNKCQIKQFRNNLNKLNIVHKIYKTVMAYGVGEAINTPGVYRQFISLLQCKNIPIYFSFILYK